MARDSGLEDLVQNALGNRVGITGKAMFGGWALMLHGNLLCGIRRESIMLRVGRENESWALKIPGTTPMVMGKTNKRRMYGYIRLSPDAYVEDEVRQKLIDAAIAFVLTLPKK